MDTTPALPPTLARLRDRLRGRRLATSLVVTDSDVPGIAVELKGLGTARHPLPPRAFLFARDDEVVGFVPEVDHLEDDDDGRSDRARRWLLDWNYRRAEVCRAGVDERDGEVRIEFQVPAGVAVEAVLEAYDEMIEGVLTYWTELVAGPVEGYAPAFVH